VVVVRTGVVRDCAVTEGGKVDAVVIVLAVILGNMVVM